MGNIKLPNAHILKQHVDSGMTRQEIADRYECHPDSVRDALKKTKKIGLGQLSMRGKEYLAALKPCGKGMTLETLHYAEEIRKADPYFKDIKSTKTEEDLLQVAEQLIERKTAPFDASAFKNHYTAALRELINQHLKGKAPKVETEEEARPSGDNVIDLMAALKKSLAGGKIPRPG